MATVACVLIAVGINLYLPYIMRLIIDGLTEKTMDRPALLQLLGTYFLLGIDFAIRPGQEVVISGEPDTGDTRKLLAALNLNFTPNKVTLVKSNQNAERLAKFAGYTDGLKLIKGQATAHVCKGFACKEPTSDIQAMVDRIKGNK